MIKADQLNLELAPNWETCEHAGFHTLSQVPGGFYCDRCKQIIVRDYCPPDEPQVLGYVTATWAWHYRDGKPWTNDKATT